MTDYEGRSSRVRDARSWTKPTAPVVDRAPVAQQRDHELEVNVHRSGTT